ncbi:MAG: hypothetical protein EAX95_10950 [Candidatus Thorarchaeota archaeon]|nr:hypothetical protein [Candidatus Thorarchaeota archaeon]
MIPLFHFFGQCYALLATGELLWNGIVHIPLMLISAYGFVLSFRSGSKSSIFHLSEEEIILECPSGVV